MNKCFQNIKINFKKKYEIKKSNNLWVIIQGGLGNQMFQVAFAVAISNRYGVVPKYVDLANKARVSRRWELKKFGFEPTNISVAFRIFILMAIFITKKLNKFKLPSLPNVLIENINYSGPPEMSYAPSILSGYWQSENHFEDSKILIRNIFKKETPGWDPWYRIKDCNRPAVAIHVRRGDYVSDPIARSVHLICDVDWYRMAWDIMLARHTNAHALVFSDDPKWARETLLLQGDVDYVAGESGSPAWVDLARMAQCTHFIISNSTYSWWAAWLGTDPNKQVIAPRFWFRGRETAELGICPVDWTLL